MKYLVVVPGYPSEENKYNNGFVHSRVKLYIEKKLDVVVFSYTSGEIREYEYEGVKVHTGGKEAYFQFLKENKFDKYLIHFGYKKVVQPIISLYPKAEMLMWVHGAEALGWYRRLFAFNPKKPHRFLGYILLDSLQLRFLHKFINSNFNVTFIFVSEWMKDILEKDSYSIGKIKKYKIIPNVVDDNIFQYTEKEAKDRYHILSIRTYQSKKYANDLTVKAILELSKESFFNELTFTLYGDGRLFDKTLKPLQNFANVKIYKKFLNHKEISEVHKKNGIMLIPTRQDAQGVSMCEAMMSGLVPVTSNNTAIPEYVPENCGYLTNNYKELALAIKTMYFNQDEFLQKSKNAHEFIQKKCSSKVVIERELEVIKSEKNRF